MHSLSAHLINNTHISIHVGFNDFDTSIILLLPCSSAHAHAHSGPHGVSSKHSRNRNSVSICHGVVCLAAFLAYRFAITSRVCLGLSFLNVFNRPCVVAVSNHSVELSGDYRVDKHHGHAVKANKESSEAHKVHYKV